MVEIKVQVIIDTYKEEIARLTNENILLKAQIKQILVDLKDINEHEENKE